MSTAPSEMETGRWRRVRLGDAIELAYGKNLPKSERREGSVPVYGSNGVTGWHDAPLVDCPTVIVGRKGSAGAVQLVEGPCFPIDTTYYTRPRPGFEFNVRFLAYALRRLDLGRLRTSTGVPGLTREDAYRELISVPPINEQHLIADLLDRADNIVRMRREAEQKAKEIIPALFLDMFGDPAMNLKGWEVARIEECCNLVRGSSPRPQGDPRYFGGPVPRLMIADITRDGIYVTPRIDSLTLTGAERSRPMNCGDVVMAVSGACGLPAILAVDACIHDGFVGFRSLSESIRAEYLYTFLSVIREQTQKQAVGATFQNLKTDQIKAWKIPVPPIRIQDSFVERAKSLRRLSDNMAQATGYSNSTFQSILAGAY